MMFDHPGIVVAEPVGGFQLRQCILIELQLAAGLPRPRQLQLIEDAEFHDVSLPRPAFCGSVFVPSAKSSTGDKLIQIKAAYHRLLRVCAGNAP
jgi:hypothetical protein